MLVSNKSLFIGILLYLGSESGELFFRLWLNPVNILLLLLNSVDLLLLCSLKLLLRRLSGGLRRIVARCVTVDVFDRSRLERLLSHHRFIRFLSLQTETSASVQGQRNPTEWLRHWLLGVQVQLSDVATLQSGSGECGRNGTLLGQRHCHHQGRGDEYDL